jgi:hypothetical protein
MQNYPPLSRASIVQTEGAFAACSAERLALALYCGTLAACDGSYCTRRCLAQGFVLWKQHDGTDETHKYREA